MQCLYFQLKYIELLFVCLFSRPTSWKYEEQKWKRKLLLEGGEKLISPFLVLNKNTIIYDLNHK